MALTTEQLERYRRQLALPEIGEEGQKKLLSASVVVVGLGGLGCPAAQYLAAAGVGKLGLVDGDRVDASNLQRQILHSTKDIGRLKVESAAEKLAALNPDVRLVLHPERLTTDGGARDVLAGYDFVVEATDNYASKFRVARACHALGKPYSHAGIQRFGGQALTVLPGISTCVRCLFEEEADSPAPAEPAGPLGSVPGVMGSLQATEAIKHILGLGVLLTDCLLVYDAAAMTFRRIRARRNPACPLCGALIEAKDVSDLHDKSGS